MHHRKAGSLAVAGLAAGALAAAPGAQASDHGLKKTIVRYEKRVAPAAKAFAKADKDLENAPDTNSASKATGDFRAGLHAFKKALVPIKSSSAVGAAAKKQMLTAIREFDLGLYQKLLEQLNAGADKATLKSTFTTLNKRIKAAADDEASALRLLRRIK
jgi:hypothetical protein